MDLKEGDSKFLKQRIDMTLADGSSVSQEYEVYANSDRKYLFTDLVTVLEGKDVEVQIVHPSKEIYIYRKGSGNNKGIQAKLTAMIDSLIDPQTTLTCKQVNGSLYEVSAHFKGELAQKAGLNSMNLLVNSSRQFIKDMTVSYLPDHKQFKTVRAHTLEFSDASDAKALQKDPISYVLTGSGTLNKEYTGFQLFDNRNRKGHGTQNFPF